MRQARIAWHWGWALLVAALDMFAPAAAQASGNAIAGLHLDGPVVAGVAFPFTVDASVTNPLGAYLSIAVEPAGSECPQLPTGFYKNNVEASGFPLKENGPPLARGSYVLCAWLSSPENAEIVYDHAALPFAVGDGGSVALSFSPTPVDGLWLTITAAGASAVSAHVITTYKPALPGAGCSATPRTDAGTGVGFAFGGTDDFGGVDAGGYSIAARGVSPRSAATCSAVG